MKYLIFLLTGIIISGNAQTTFQKYYDSCNDGVGAAVSEREEGYFVLGTSPFKGCLSFLLLDSMGDMIESKEFSLLPEAKVTAHDQALLEDDRGDYLILGRIKDSIFWDPYLMKISGETLDMVWTKRYRTPGQDKSLSIKAYKGGYLLLSEMLTPIWIDSTTLFWNEAEMLFTEVDTAGNVKRQEVVQDTFKYSFPGNFEVLDNGDIALVHDSNNERFFQDGYISLLDSTFAIKWTRALDEQESDYRPTILKMKGGQEFLVSCRNKTYFGLTVRWVNSGRVYSYNLAGDVLWEQNFYTGAEFDIRYGSIASNGDILLCGSDQENALNDYHSYGRIVRLNSEGKTLWDRMYELPGHPINDSWLHHIIETKDGGILATGYMYNLIQGGNLDLDIYVLKLDSEGCLTSTCDSIVYPYPYYVPVSTVEPGGKAAMEVYPNPSSGQVNFSLSDDVYGRKEKLLIISDMAGKRVGVFNWRKTEDEFIWEPNDGASGFYYYQLLSEGIPIAGGKIVLKK